jgi:dihydroorotate dehydrogenase electron transfer subunit
MLVGANAEIAPGVYRMQLYTDGVALTEELRPGQFVNLKIDGFYLRRPISICDWSHGVLTLVYKAVGEGTRHLSAMEEGAALRVLLPLGNGYTLLPDKQPVLVGGGVGIPPLYYLCKELIRAGQKPTAILGFNTASEVFLQSAFAALCDTILTTVDGSAGVKGFVTDALPKLNPDTSTVYTCGPEAMLRAVFRSVEFSSVQFSFEERMGCGFGACMCCSCKTVTGYKRICKDGPVLRREEILW